MLGTENIKETLSGVIRITESFADALADGKINFVTEGIPLITNLVVIPKIITSGKAALAELKDLDEEEAKEVAAYFALNFDIANDDLEVKIESAINLLADSYEFITGVFPLIKKWKDYVGGYKKVA